MDPIFFAKVEKGKAHISDKALFRAYVATLEGKAVDVIIRKHKVDRTHSQNRYYWAAVVGIPAKHFGYLPEEMHDAFKLMFLFRDDEGKPKTTRSTTTLSTSEFSEYVEKCRQWCAEQGLDIPDPERIDLA